MTSLYSLTHVVGWVLIHFVWQAAVIGIMHAIAMNKLAGKSPASRHNVSLLFLVTILAMPFITAPFIMDNGVGHDAQAGAPVISVTESHAAATLPDKIPADVQLEKFPEAALDYLMPVLVIAWLIGVLIFSVRLHHRHKLLQHIVRTARESWIPDEMQQKLESLKARFGLSGNIRLMASTLIDSPMVTGWIVPTILFPVAALTRLDTQQLSIVLAHELAHIKRHDYLINLLQLLAEVLFFFHPAVHSISRRIREEREYCCDDIAASHCTNSILYARTLISLESMRQRKNPVLSLGMSDGELSQRIHRIVGIPGLGRKAPIEKSLLIPVTAIIILLFVHANIEQPKAFLQTRLAIPQMAIPDEFVPIREAPGEPELSTEGMAQGAAQSLDSSSREDPAAPEESEMHAGEPPVTGDMAVPETDRTDLGTSQEQQKTTSGNQPGEITAHNAEHANDNPTAANEPVTDSMPGPDKVSGGAVVYSVAPEYPVDALIRGKEGYVTLEFTITENGDVASPEVIEAEPRRVFDRAAVRAISDWRYTPFMVNDIPQKRKVQQTLHFTITDTADQAGSDKQVCRERTGSNICKRVPGSSSTTRIKVID